MHSHNLARIATAMLLAIVGFIAIPDAGAAPARDAKALRVGAERSFWVIGSGRAEYDRLEATLVYDGRLARIWVDNRDTARIDDAVLAELARGLESETPAGSRNPAKGIIENEQDVFGPSPSRFKVGGKDDFLLFDIPNTATEGLTLLGYFHTKDQFKRSEVPSSNELNMLYIDSREGMKSVRRLLSTIAHEYQHLVHYGRNPESERFYTEAMSELATVITGFRLSAHEYMAETNSPMFRWSDDDARMSQVDYQRGMMLMRYLYEQYGESFIHAFVDAEGTGVERIENALVATRSTEGDWRDVLVRFAVANYLQDDGQGEYGYSDTDLWSVRQTRPSVIDVGAIPAAYRPSRARLQPFGTSYLQFDSPRVLSIDAPSSADYDVVALSFGDGTVSIEKLEAGRRYDLGAADGSVDRVVLAYVSLSADQQMIRTGIANGTRVAME